MMRAALTALAAVALLLAAAPARPALASEADDVYARALDLCWQGRDAESLPLAERAVELARRTGDRSREAWALNLIGDCNFGLGRFPEAIRGFEAALPVMRETEDRLGEATALKNIGITCRYVGRYDDGISSLFQSIELYRELGDAMSLVSALANLGQAYANVGAARFAYEAYREGLEIADRHSRECDASVTIDLHVRLGNLFADSSELETALDHFRRAQALAAGFRMAPDTRHWILEGLSCTLQGLGRADEALAVRRECVELSHEAGNPSSVASNLLGLAGLLDDRDPDLAMRYRFEALEILTRTNPLNTWEVYFDIGQAKRARNDPAAAIDYFERAVDQLELVRGRMGSESFRSLFYSRHQRYYHALIDTLVERGEGPRAFEVYERAKARSMLDAFAEARVDAGEALSPALRERRELLDARIRTLDERLVAEGATDEQRARLLDDLNRAEEELDSLVAEIRRENPKYAAVRYPTPLTVEAARALVEPGTALVAYTTTETAATIFVVTGDGFAFERLAVAPDLLAARVRNYVDLLSSGDGAESGAIGRRLYDELVAPIRGLIGPGVTRLVVVPDGALNQLPFEALASGEGRFLVEDFTISYAPSATVLAELRRPNGSAGAADRADVLVIADPAAQRETGELPTDRVARALYEDERFAVAPLPSTRDEAESIARHARPGSVVLTGGDATEHNVKAAGLDRFRVVHFATHGLVSERAPYRSALVLARAAGDGEDGFLQAREIYRLRLQTDLVVLSACQTGRGQVIVGDGVQSLARAFMHAGSRSVVASLWNVNDESTARFMEAFYSHLASGEAKADALRNAKLEMLGDPATASPRAWAAFVLVGEPSEPVPIGAPPSPWWVVWALLAIAGLGVLLWWAIRTVRGSARWVGHEPAERYRTRF
jgi:CHAT domain-containing protein